MSMALEDVTREAIGLPRHQRLSLARFLIELDDPGSEADVEAAWEHRWAVRELQVGRRRRVELWGTEMKVEALVLLASVLPLACAAAPAFVTSDPSGGWSNGGYYVHNNMWNTAKCDSCVRHGGWPGLIP
jgi:hypothetical protein